MARQMIIIPGKCIGCSTCALTCSFTYHGQFNPGKSYISIRKHDFDGVFEITFSSRCKSCKKCAQSCPSGALGIVDMPEPVEDNPNAGKIWEE